MNPSTPPPDGGYDLTAILTWVWIIGLSTLGGIVSFWQKIKTGHARAWNFTELVGEIATSGLAGIITANLADSINAPASLKYALVGIVAHMGSRGLLKLESLANSKFNLPMDVQAPVKETDHAAG
jgi:hypothetical protein